jgi:putative ABC transport system permease protein
MPHVNVVSPVIWQIATGGGLEVIDGIDLKSFEALGGPFQYLQGGPFQGPNDILVDDYIARQKHVKVGDTMEVLNHDFRVAGIVENGRGARKFIPMSTLQEMEGAKDKASVFYLKLDSPEHTAAVVNEIMQQPGMEKYTVLSTSDYLSMMTPSHLPGFRPFIGVVIGVSLIIGFLVIFQSMYAAVMERTREIGILKAMGASKFYIVSAILRETGLLAAGGIVLGILFSFAASWGIRHFFPTVQVVVSIDWVARAIAVAVVGALAGALYPAFKAAGKDPIEALAYE